MCYTSVCLLLWFVTRNSSSRIGEAYTAMVVDNIYLWEKSLWDTFNNFQLSFSYFLLFAPLSSPAFCCVTGICADWIWKFWGSTGCDQSNEWDSAVDKDCLCWLGIQQRSYKERHEHKVYFLFVKQYNLSRLHVCYISSLTLNCVFFWSCICIAYCKSCPKYLLQ